MKRYVVVAAFPCFAVFVFLGALYIFPWLFPANKCDVATHTSGTIIDLILTECSTPPIDVHSIAPGSIAASDHGLAYFTLRLRIELQYRIGFGRVAWSTEKDWSCVLEAASSGLQSLADLVDDMCKDVHLRKLVVTQSQIRRRRVLLEGTIWLRDA